MMHIKMSNHYWISHQTWDHSHQCHQLWSKAIYLNLLENLSRVIVSWSHLPCTHCKWSCLLSQMIWTLLSVIRDWYLNIWCGSITNYSIHRSRNTRFVRIYTIPMVLHTVDPSCLFLSLQGQKLFLEGMRKVHHRWALHQLYSQKIQSLAIGKRDRNSCYSSLWTVHIEAIRPATVCHLKEYRKWTNK